MNLKKLLSAAAFAVLVFPFSTSAHGHTSFEINEKVYSFTVGSLNEPVAVDDKTGLDLKVVSMTHQQHRAMETSGMEISGKPVAGLDQTLKVELIAGDKKKTLDISPAYGAPGSYRAVFIPTVQTTFSYRIFGEIDGVPFDYTFTCNPAGHPQAEEDTTEVEISPGVMRIEAAGAFGCPAARADLGFPEPTVTSVELLAADGIIMGQVSSTRTIALFGLGLAVIGVFFTIRSSKKGRGF